jgi:hypothetical protein
LIRCGRVVRDGSGRATMTLKFVVDLRDRSFLTMTLKVVVDLRDRSFLE